MRAVNNTISVRVAVALATVLVVAVAVAAQERDAKITPLELRQVRDVAGGKIAAVEGEVDADGLRFGIGDLSVLQPVEIRVSATDASRPVRLEVTKFGFDGVLKEATTGADGLAVLRFRTELGVALAVKAATPPAPFQLVAWVGDELTNTPATILTPMRGRDEERRGWGLRYAAGGLALAAVVVIVLVRTRRSK